MEVIVKRTYENDFKLDESEPDYYTEEIKFDADTFDAAQKGLFGKNGTVSVCKLLGYVHDNAVGKITTSGDARFVPQLIFGDLAISIQCNYKLYSARIDTYGCDKTEELKDSPMTQKEWGLIIGSHSINKRNDYPFDAYFDVCVFRKSDQHMLIEPCTMSLRMISFRLTDLLKLHKITD